MSYGRLVAVAGALFAQVVVGANAHASPGSSAFHAAAPADVSQIVDDGFGIFNNNPSGFNNIVADAGLFLIQSGNRTVNIKGSGNGGTITCWYTGRDIASNVTFVTSNTTNASGPFTFAITTNMGSGGWATLSMSVFCSLPANTGTPARIYGYN